MESEEPHHWTIRWGAALNSTDRADIQMMLDIGNSIGRTVKWYFLLPSQLPLNQKTPQYICKEGFLMIIVDQKGNPILILFNTKTLKT